MSRLPEPMRRRIEEQQRRPTVDKVRDFLGGELADAEDLDEVRDGMRRTAAHTTRGLKEDLAALEAFLAEPQPPGTLMKMVAWDANWVLEGPSDEAAAMFLRQVADMLRDVIAEADAGRRGAGGGRHQG